MRSIFELLFYLIIHQAADCQAESVYLVRYYGPSVSASARVRSSASTLLPYCFTHDYRKLAANPQLWEIWQGVCGATAPWCFVNKNGRVTGRGVRSDDAGLKEDISTTWPEASVGADA